MTHAESSARLLEAIRRKEAEVKRRLAAEREAAEAVIAAAERQARERLIAADIEGRRAGEVQRQVAQIEAGREADAILARARTEAETLQRAGEPRLVTAVAQAVAIVIGSAHEA